MMNMIEIDSIKTFLENPLLDQITDNQKKVCLMYSREEENSWRLKFIKNILIDENCIFRVRTSLSSEDLYRYEFFQTNETKGVGSYVAVVFPGFYNTHNESYQKILSEMICQEILGRLVIRPVVYSNQEVSLRLLRFTPLRLDANQNKCREQLQSLLGRRPGNFQCMVVKGTEKNYLVIRFINTLKNLDEALLMANMKTQQEGLVFAKQHFNFANHLKKHSIEHLHSPVSSDSFPSDPALYTSNTPTPHKTASTMDPIAPLRMPYEKTDISYRLLNETPTTDIIITDESKTFETKKQGTVERRQKQTTSTINPTVSFTMQFPKRSDISEDLPIDITSGTDPTFSNLDAKVPLLKCSDFLVIVDEDDNSSKMESSTLSPISSYIPYVEENYISNDSRPNASLKESFELTYQTPDDTESIEISHNKTPMTDTIITDESTTFEIDEQETSRRCQKPKSCGGYIDAVMNERLTWQKTVILICFVAYCLLMYNLVVWQLDRDLQKPLLSQGVASCTVPANSTPVTFGYTSYDGHWVLFHDKIVRRYLCTKII